MLIGLCAVALILGVAQKRKHDAHSVDAADGGQVTASTGNGEQTPAPATTRSSFQRREATPSPVPARSQRTEPSPQTRQLVKNLSELDARPGLLTPEKAEAWRKDLSLLLNESRSAVPAIAEFLQKNQDLKFDPAVTNLLKEPTMRIALLRLLFDIPAPDNVDLEEEVLKTTTDPAEIALLAYQLEMQEPGKYREAIVEAAQFSLQRINTGTPLSHEVDLLAEVIKRYEVSTPAK